MYTKNVVADGFVVSRHDQIYETRGRWRTYTFYAQRCVGECARVLQGKHRICLINSRRRFACELLLWRSGRRLSRRRYSSRMRDNDVRPRPSTSPGSVHKLERIQRAGLHGRQLHGHLTTLISAKTTTLQWAITRIPPFCRLQCSEVETAAQ
jgi:hypothetical protein